MLNALGQKTLALLRWSGRGALFALHLIWCVPAAFMRPRLILEQLYHVGVLSLPIIVVAGLFVGMVLSLQGYTNLVRFGAESSLGAVLALALVRELGPVLSALLFAGRAGSALAAEIGLMKATEQLSSMELMAVDPVARVMAPRFVAGVVALPLLASVFTAVAIFGGYLFAVTSFGLDSGAFWSQMQSAVHLTDDVLAGVVLKSVVFGLVAAAIAVFEGQDALPTAAGVSRATTRTVVHTSLAVLGLDFLLTAALFGGL